MRFSRVAIIFLSAGISILAQDFAGEIWQLESKGDALQARARLQKAAEASPRDLTAVRAYAEFLDRHRDPAARVVYAALDKALPRNSPDRLAVLRRLAVLDLIAGDRAAAVSHVNAFRDAGGSGLSMPAAAPPPAIPESFIEIPGPLRSFARMAALSQELRPEDLLAALARNVVSSGYQAVASADTLEQTEYLKLVVRYLSQAREIERLGGETKVIRIETCESAATAELLRILGYRMRGACGSEVVLETINATRAFLTIDSGFPLAELETALRTNHTFVLDYHPSRVPLLYTADYWQSAKEKATGEFIDFFLSDPSLCRLYIGLAQLDPETANALHDSIPAPRLKIYSHVLDYYGGMFQIRGGKAIVPGAALAGVAQERRAAAEKAWTDLVGAQPSAGAAFIEKLVAKDDGWLASYYDALARIQGPVADYLCDPVRMKRFYDAVRGRVSSPGPARPVFRANTDMMLLTARLRLDRDGKPHIPGDLALWKNLFVNHPQGKYDAKLSKAAANWKDSDDVLEALFALSRKAVENEPLKIFMALSDVERSRTVPLEPATVERLAHEYSSLSAQYPLFSGAPALTDKTILAYLDATHILSKIGDQGLRADAAGTLQALAGLWQIFVRQGTIPAAQSDRALAQITEPFEKIQNEREIFDSGRSGVKLLLEAANSPKNISVQDRMIDLLGGAPSSARSQGARYQGDAQQQMAEDMIRVFEAQRLVSLSTILDFADNLETVGRGEKLNAALAGKLSARISDVQLPRNAFTANDRNPLAYGYYIEKHIEQQRKLNLRQAIERAAGDPNKLKDLRGALAPFLRDTLVGYNYMLLRSARRADSAHQSTVCSQPRFCGSAIPESDLESDPDVRHRMACQCRRKVGRLPRIFALRSGRGGTEFPHIPSRGSMALMLGRTWFTANDHQRDRSALVGCHASPASLGRPQYGLRRDAACGKCAQP